MGDESVVPVKHLIMVGSPKICVKSYVAKTTAIYDPGDLVVNNVGLDLVVDDKRGGIITHYKPGKTISNVNLILNPDKLAFLGGHMDYFDKNNYKAVGYEILQVIKGAIK